MNQPLLSIAIPTRNRYETLIPVVKSLLLYIQSDNYEIVIQDNSDDTKILEEWLLTVTDKKVKYFYTSRRVSQSDNSSYAIDNCTGTYVIFIGDDDLVSPYICDIVDKMESLNINCLTYTPGNYYWKGISFAKRSFLLQTQVLYLPNNISDEILVKKSDKVLKRCFNNGVVSLDTLPKIYHGVVKKDLLIQIKNRWGSYFPGSSPDMASSVALSLITKDFYSINYPVSITGCSPKSAAGLGATSKHVGKIEDQIFLPKNVLENWNRYVPRIWTGPSIYAQTASEVLGDSINNYSINYYALYAYMMNFHPDLKSIINTAIKNINKLLLIKLVVIYYYYIKILFRRSIDKVKRLFGFYSMTSVKNMNDVDTCMRFLLHIKF